MTKTLVTPPDALSTGSTFAGRYQIIEELGRGGMGRVYKVVDTEINSKVALKLLRPEIAADPKTIERFRNELKIARDIAHKNICRMYDLNKVDSSYFITMEYVEGQDLKSLIRQTGNLTIKAALSIARQVCEGLTEAHKRDVVHRDLKPSNIMIDRAGDARIMDFGIARALESKGLTGEGVMIGTPEYMSPEQVEGKEIDHRSDIYGLGIILFEMLTGRLPFEADSAFNIAMKHKTEIPPTPTDVNPDIPDDVSALILRCLKKDKKQRYQSAEELLSDLREIESEISTTKAIAPKKKPVVSREFSLKFSLKKLLIPALIFLAIGAVVIVSVFVIQKMSQSRSSLPTHKQITFRGKASWPAISPDGNFLAYIDEQKPYSQKLIMMDLISGQTQEIFQALNISDLIWSPDGADVSFWASSPDGKLGLYSVSRLGGAPLRSQMGFGAIQTWSPDGSQYAYSIEGSKEITIKDKASGNVQSIPMSMPYIFLWSIDWSPLGNLLLFLTVDDQDKHSIWTMTVEGKELKKVFEDKRDISQVLWSSTGRAIYFLSGDELWKVPVSSSSGEPSGSASVILSGLQSTGTFSITKDGKRLFYTKVIQYSNLWLYSIEGSNDKADVKKVQLTSGTMFNEQPSISPDGKQIAFAKGDGKKSNIYVMPLMGGDSQQLTFLDSLNMCPVWSPDGEEIAFGSTEWGAPSVCKIRISDKKITRFEKTITDLKFQLEWSPGPKILYQTAGMKNIRVLNPNTGDEVPLVKEEQGWMFMPRYSPDAKSIAFLWNNGTSENIWIFSSDGTQQRDFERKEFYGLEPLGWSSDGKWLYVFDAWSNPKSVKRIEVNTNRTEIVFNLSFELYGPSWRTGLRLSPDDKRIVLTEYEYISDVWLVENFDPDIQ